MADIMDYMEWRGDVTFDMIPVNEVDGLIFSQFAYIPLEGVIDDMSGEMSVLEAGSRFFDIHSEEEISGYTELLKNCCRVFKGMMNCDRFKNLKIKYGNPFKIENMSLEEANQKLYKEVERLMKEN